MPTNIVMPKTGADTTEAKLIRWLKNDGDAISRGDVVAEIETDKVNMEIEAYGAGTLHRLIPEGTTLPVGEPVALLLKEGETPPSGAAGAAPAPTQPAAAPQPAAAAEPQAAAAPPERTAAAPPGQPNAPAAPRAAGAPAEPAEDMRMADRPLNETPGPDPASAARQQPQQGPAPLAASAAPAAPLGVGSTNGHAPDARIKASPLARRMAQEHNLDLSRISGRGPGGRVVKEDVEAAIRSGVAAPAAAPEAPAPARAPVAPAPEPAPMAATAERPAGVTVKELTRIQLTTGRRLSESKQQAPHFYLTVEVDMAEALALRATLNEKAAGAFKISVNDLVIKAATWALGRHPTLNSSFQNGKLLLYEHVHIAVAVAIESGLVSPVLFDADRKSLGQIARESRALIERARTGKLRPDDLSGGTFTVSNLGMYDMDNFVAIINPPQAAILAVGAVREIPVVRNGQIAIGQVMKATLSVDHRAADGAQGAQFLADVRSALESPLLMAL